MQWLCHQVREETSQYGTGGPCVPGTMPPGPMQPQHLCGAGKHYPYYMGKGTPRLSPAASGDWPRHAPSCRDCTDATTAHVEGTGVNVNGARSTCTRPLLRRRGSNACTLTAMLTFPRISSGILLASFNTWSREPPSWGRHRREKASALRRQPDGAAADMDLRDAEVAGIKTQHFPGAPFPPQEPEASHSQRQAWASGRHIQCRRGRVPVRAS